MVDYEQPEKTKLINHCMLAGRIIITFDPEQNTAVVSRDILSKSKGSGYEVMTGKQTVKIDKDLTQVLSAGDNIAVHLGYLAAKISDEQMEILKYWTRKVARLI